MLLTEKQNKKKDEMGHRLSFKDKACGKLPCFGKSGARNSAWSTGVF